MAARFAAKIASKSLLLMFPVVTCSSLAGNSFQQERVNKVAVLRHDDAIVHSRYSIDFIVPRPILIGQIERVNRIMSRGSKLAGQSPRQLGIDEQLHGDTATVRFTRASSAAYA